MLDIPSIAMPIIQPSPSPPTHGRGYHRFFRQAHKCQDRTAHEASQRYNRCSVMTACLFHRFNIKAPDTVECQELHKSGVSCLLKFYRISFCAKSSVYILFAHPAHCDELYIHNPITLHPYKNSHLIFNSPLSTVVLL